MKVVERRPNGSIRVHTVNNEPDMCQQEHKDDCDTNKLVARFMRDNGGMLPNMPLSQGVEVVDQTGVSSLSLDELHNEILLRRKSFDSMPDKIKARFENSPDRFLKFVLNPDNKQEGIDLGLFNPSKKVDSGSETINATNANIQEPK